MDFIQRISNAIIKAIDNYLEDGNTTLFSGAIKFIGGSVCDKDVCDFLTASLDITLQ